MQERNIALKLMYVGTAYHGWQVQKNAVSVAETLEKALSTVVCHPVKCTGAGRTDAGVHAEVYIANFHTRSSIPTDRIPLAVNTRLPDDIVVVKATEVPEHFNAIGSCLRKEYTYRIYNSRLGNAFYVNRAWFYPKHLDESIMQRAADCFVGTHDFSAVRAVGTEVRSRCVPSTTSTSLAPAISSSAGYVPTGSSTIWYGLWWVPAFTPPRASLPPRT